MCITEALKGFSGIICKPYNIVVVSKEEFLGVLPRVVHNPNSSYEVHDLLARRVEQIVPALMSTVAIDPF
jgi:hypothetical protein